MEGEVLPCCCSLGCFVHQYSKVFTKKVQFVLTSCEFGSVSKHVSVSLDNSFFSLHQSADLYLNTL